MRENSSFKPFFGEETGLLRKVEKEHIMREEIHGPPYIKEFTHGKRANAPK